MTALRPLRASFWTRLRFQIPVGVLLAAVLPYLLRLAIDAEPGDIGVLNNTLAGTMVAIVLGAWLMRNVATYPGSEALAYTLPAFGAAFGALLIVYVFGRIPYNRVNLSAGFAISLLWFFIMAVLAQRRQRLTIGVLPFGQVGQLHDIPNVSWRMLTSPDDDISDLDAIAADLRIDLPSEWDRRLADYALNRVSVFHVKHLIESLTGRVELEHLSENSFGSLAPRQDYMVFKAVLDWLAAAVLGLLLLPLLLLVGLLVRLTSDGPALFRQQRIGYQGRPFWVYKFRTMRVADGDDRDERDLAITRDRDHRITPLGRFLRKSRIDELPQLINVLRGEMSLIGPRPEAVVLSRWYEKEIPFYRYRHIVRPGIAGWAQVCQGHVADVDAVRSKLHYDFYYIKQYSPWIDLLIVVRTIRTMVTGFGAR
ncbi:polyprenyl glycosylphosphotransferase [Erythrobacteraceae bacterium CFH 75059]|uniref:sugar transferase n=1 Tax=Qipengyuania thermophila TaxID=2509361 RepID=UPI0010217CF8|nr:sugar transferase [Qipengyuania thermophila]TCD04329.1 polyprenyl glycosylphosphotransferase [Erythrobacteraceae bacterium CFH 75059]